MKILDSIPFGKGLLPKKTSLTSLWIFTLLISLSACGPFSKKNKVIKECILPDDQSGTLNGRWPLTPIPVAVFSGDFSAEEQKRIGKAIDTWNQFYQASQGFPLLEGSETSLPTSTTSKPSFLCSKALLSNSQFIAPVVIYKSSSWPYDKDIIALTSNCTAPDQPLKRFYMGIMELNYEHFFIPGTRIPDLQSIAVHELGHLIGLGHTCENFKKNGTPNCQDDIPETYFKAIMYPDVLFLNGLNGEVKQTLQENDMGRANCIYQSTESPP